MFKFNFNKSKTSTIIPSYTISKRTIDYLPINKKNTPHNLNINDLTDIVVELDNEIENLKIIKIKIEEILSNKRKTEIKKDDISKIYDNCLSVEQIIENKENNKEIIIDEIRTQKDDGKKPNEIEIKKENNLVQLNTENEQSIKINNDIEKKDNKNNIIDQINILKNIDEMVI